MKRVKNKIKNAFNNIVLPDFDMKKLEKRKGLILEDNKIKQSKNGWILGISTCLAVFVCLFVGLGYFNNNIKIASTIGIDVNPSITVKVNKKEKVLEVTANNDDAKIILEGMDLEGADINVAVNALIGSMVKNGYIDELANSILISVDNPNSAKSEALRQKIVNELNTFLTNNNISVVSQSITANSDKETLAKKYGISIGKLELIEKLIAKNNLYTYEELKDLSINELNLLLNNSTDNVTTSGVVSDKAYIGQDKALEIALNAADISSATWSKVEMDYDDGLMTYEVEFTYDNKEFEYEINATTGDIISYDNEYEDHINNNHSSTNNSSSTNSNSSNNNTSNNASQANSNANASNISATISGYQKEADNILSSINNLVVSGNHSQVYHEWELKIESLDKIIDKYDDDIERMYKNGQLSLSVYKEYEHNLKTIENTLERAENTLERVTGYDD